MTDEETPKKIIVDSDWKQEAAEEKKRLEKEAAKTSRRGPAPEASFLELVNMIAMQAAIGMGGFQTDAGEKVPPDLAAAKHFVDLLSILDEKTAGNLSDEEKRTLDSVLYELRLRYVEVASAPPVGKPVK